MQMLQQHHLLLLPRQLRLRPLLQQLLVMTRQQMPALQLQRTAHNSKPLPLLLLHQPLPQPVLPPLLLLIVLMPPLLVVLLTVLPPPLLVTALLLRLVVAVPRASLRRARVVGASVTRTTASYSLCPAGRLGATVGRGVTRVTLPLLPLLQLLLEKRPRLPLPLLLRLVVRVEPKPAAAGSILHRSPSSNSRYCLQKRLLLLLLLLLLLVTLFGMGKQLQWVLLMMLVALLVVRAKSRLLVLLPLLPRAVQRRRTG
jgi:hypothetical protein